MVTTPTEWLGEHQANSTVIGSQSDPAIVDIGDGRYVVVWTESTGGPIGTDPGTDLVGQIFDAEANPVGDEFQVNSSFVADNEQNAALASRPGGGFIMVYEDTNADGTSIRVETRDVNGEIVGGGPVTIQNDNPGNDDVLSNPTIAVRPDGSYFVGYTRLRASDGLADAVARIVSADGTVGSEFEIFDNQFEHRDPDIAVLSSGNYIVVWERHPPDFDPVFLTHNQFGEELNGGPIDDNDNPQTDVHVAALAGGGFVVTWTEDFGESGEGIRARIYDNEGEPIAGVFTANSSTDGDQNESDMVALPDGGFIVIWDNDELGLVRGRRFDADGNAIGNEFTAGSEGSEFNPVVAALSDGRFVVGFQDTSGSDDIWAKIWDPRTGPIIGTGDDDVLTSRINGATVKGRDGADTLLGQEDIDTLKGGDGKDLLAGREGDDALTGGKGADSFLFDTTLSAATNVDRVHDFKHNTDTIQLDEAIFTEIGGMLGAGEFFVGAEARAAGHRIGYNPDNGNLIYDDNGSDAGGATRFARLDKNLDIDNGDFLMV